MPNTVLIAVPSTPDFRGLRRRRPLCAHLFLSFFLLLLFTHPLCAAEIIPPAPARYIIDDAHVLTPTVADDLNSQLDQFERDTSNQLVVAIYPHMQSDSDVADYTTRVFHAWKVGQKGKNNGVALFIFTQDHKMQIITGYGLEGALPDVTCKEIIDNEIAPRFKANDFDGGVQNGVKAIMAATRGEYKGTGHSAADGKNNDHSLSETCFIWFIFIGVIAFLVYAQRKGWVRSSPYSGMMLGSGGWSSGGSWGGGGGGGFSGGGGDTGGGGAGGSW